MRKLRLFFPFFIYVLTAPQLASATMAVIDTSAIAKLTDQLSKMQKQIDVLGEVSDKVQSQIDAVGKVGQISLPILNARKIASQIRQDMQCLKPDLSKLMPDVTFEDMNWNSVCEAAPAYQKTLWLDPSSLKDLPTWQDQEKAVQKIEQRRENVLVDATIKGLAHADIAGKDVDRTNKAASELAASINAASTSNDRLAAIAQGQVILVRALAQQNQILAQMLRVQSAFAIKAGVPVESFMSEADKNKKAGAK